MKLLKRTALILLLGGLVVIVALNIWVIRSTEHLIYLHPESVPEYPVGLVLGTAIVFHPATPILIFSNV